MPIVYPVVFKQEQMTVGLLQVLAEALQLAVDPVIFLLPDQVEEFQYAVAQEPSPAVFLEGTVEEQPCRTCLPKGRSIL